jgi:magnesium transporter
VLAAASAAVIPMTIAACGRDPAQSASIFLTTITDIVGFGTFLGIAAVASAWLV